MIVTDEKLLRVKCIDALPDDVGPIIDQLERELRYSGELGRPGIGLACPQIGLHTNICIVRVKGHSINLVNAKIAAGYDKTIFDAEGCLSFPDRYEKTMRYGEIYVINNLVEPHSFVCTGLLAVVVQHELDHLQGVLLPDVALPKIKKEKLRPNDKCGCGSEKKFKKCCGR